MLFISFLFPDPGASSRVIDAFGEWNGEPGNGGPYSKAKQIDIDIEPNRVEWELDGI